MSRTVNTRTAAAAFGAGLLLSALATVQPVFAAEPVVQQTVEDIRPNGPPIRLSLTSGTLIRLPKGASTAFIADPTIADIHITSPTTILLYAKKGGDTVMYTEGGEGEVLMNTVIRVRPLEVIVMRPTDKPEPKRPDVHYHYHQENTNVNATAVAAK
jgi:pilus assembly protein CpaC